MLVYQWNTIPTLSTKQNKTHTTNYDTTGTTDFFRKFIGRTATAVSKQFNFNIERELSTIGYVSHTYAYFDFENKVSGLTRS